MNFAQLQVREEIPLNHAFPVNSLCQSQSPVTNLRVSLLSMVCQRVYVELLCERVLRTESIIILKRG